MSDVSPLPVPTPVVLVILDGWGHREELAHNAIAAARTPVWDKLMHEYPHGLINASELHVGLPAGQMGNSEVGHMNIGSGRVVMQDLPRIDQAIETGALQTMPDFTGFCARVKTKTVHLLGLASDGGVHAHVGHMAALALALSQKGLSVRIHAFLDGRDTPPQSALTYMQQLESAIAGQPDITVATLCGRYYAMDRDKRWDRVQKAYDTLKDAAGARYTTAHDAITASYEAGITDEFLLPCAIGAYEGMKEGDGLIMANFRADRAREILTALLDPSFADFPRTRKISLSATLGMAEYSSKLTPLIPPLFAPEPLTRIFGEIVAEAGLRQLRIAETEKYAHVTFFFNCGREEPYPGEERILIPSPKVATYDEKPEMSAPEVTDALVKAINARQFDVIICNYANTDMVGHTGDIAAASKAVEAVDTCLGRVVEAALAQGGALLVTADHGNAEMMFDNDTHQPHTAHTLNLVPALLVVPQLKGKKLHIPEGRLGDVAPTLLQLLRIPQPAEMTGRSLLAGYGA
ncbi:MAG: 2,3-bisphosphoglycerate-independent phosphoglycerate mutase [Proteobacteria bacterium]|nr:2,3-bisphosphoglycerate-independent phosphoglycerate mutase [Pseudomonadota bacterium]